MSTRKAELKWRGNSSIRSIHYVSTWQRDKTAHLKTVRPDCLQSSRRYISLCTPLITMCRLRVGAIYVGDVYSDLHAV